MRFHRRIAKSLRRVGSRTVGPSYRVKLPTKCSPAASGGPHRGLVLLVVEDDDETRDLYIAAFTQAGYLVHGAGSVALARSLLRQIHADVLVADYDLPDGTGDEVARICTEAKSKACVLVTGSDVDTIQAKGFDLTLRKPISSAALVAAIRALVA